MLVSPYDTTICRHYKVAQITTAIQRADIEAPLSPLTTAVGNEIRGAAFIAPKDDYDNVMGFTQFVDVGKADAPKWVIDGRPFMRWDRRTDSYRLVAENDFSFQCMRIALTHLLQDKGPSSFFKLGDVPGKTFVRWLTLAIAQRYNLALDHQIRVSVIAAYYYYTQLSATLSLTPEEVQLRARMVGRLVGIPAATALDLGEQLGSLGNAELLAKAIAEHSGSVRLAGLKFTDLYTIIAASWVGVNARENVGVALEHMPTWIAMVYAGLDERSYRKTILSLRAASTGRQSEIKQFTDAVFQLVASRFV